VVGRKIARPVNLVQAHLGDRMPEQIADDRTEIEPGDLVLLVVEDDHHFAKIISDLAHERGFKIVATTRGTDVLDLAQQYRPTAISLDLFLPDMLGWNILRQLKRDPETRHIPVQIVSLEEERQHGLACGAFSFITKPSSAEALGTGLDRIKAFSEPRRKRLLVVEDNEAERLSIVAVLAHDDVEIETAASGSEALQMLHNGGCDCVVLDLRLPDMNGFEVLDEIGRTSSLAEIPVVVFTGRELTADDEARLRAVARSVVVKGVESPERLLDETALFLHRRIGDLPASKQRMLERLNGSDDDLVDRTVLLVDDDARNIFALSNVLERRGMKVLAATNGKDAVDALAGSSDVSVVLMDIMMPGMDGYQTMQAIRGDPCKRRLPIIALTAKAMKGDREKCIEAGASDYLAKPVNTEQLLSTLRVWLHR
jgi:CheY-like chemotaxis protein